MKRESQVLIRLSNEEKRGFEDAAKLGGISLSSWARERLRRAAIRELQDANRLVAFLPKIGMNGEVE